MFRHNTFRILADLFWPFFPIFVVVLVLSLFGKLDQLASRSDLVLVAAVLFAEGWWRIRKVFSLTKAAFEMIGFLGALVAVFLATVMLLTEIGGINQLSVIASSERFGFLRLSVEIASVLYALVVRVKVYKDEDWRADYYHESMEKLRHYESGAKGSTQQDNEM
jgi:hypothetical protein